MDRLADGVDPADPVPAGRDLDGRSVGDLFDDLELSPAARFFLDQDIRDDYLVEPGRLSLLFHAAEWELPGSAAGAERYRLRGGNDRLPRALAAALPPGAVVLNAPVTAIAQDPAAARITTIAGAMTFAADCRAIRGAAAGAARRDLRSTAARPAPRGDRAAPVWARHQDPPPVRRARLAGGRVQRRGLLRPPGGDVLGGDRRPARPHGDPARVHGGRPRRRLGRARCPGGASPRSPATPSGSSPRCAAASSVARPRAAATSPTAPGSVPAPYWQALRRPAGRIVLAGEHTDTWNGYMNGAVRSGARVAALVDGRLTAVEQSVGARRKEPAMESSSTARVLVVANKTAATPGLLEAVRERAGGGSCSFTLLVPSTAHGLHKVVDPQDHPTKARPSTCSSWRCRCSRRRPAATSRAMIGDPEPLAAIQDAVNLNGFDEIIISTLPTRVSRWLRLDLPSKAAGLGLPVTTVTAKGRVETAVPS